MQAMKTLIITNMYPSRDLPYSGIFIQNQYRWMNRKIADNETVEIFFMRQRLTSLWGSIRKYTLTYLRFFPFLFQPFDNLHVHYMGWLLPLAVAYKLVHPKARLILTLHGGDINEDLPEKGWQRRFFQKLTRRVDVLISVGRSLNTTITSKLNRHVDYNLCAGISKRTFHPIPYISKRYDFLFVGSFLPIKGLDILLQSMDHYLSRGARYCFVGNGPMEMDIREKINDYPEQIQILGNLNQEELREIYNASYFLLFPSLGDAFGLVVTEAMFCGTPAVIFRGGGADEQVEDHQNGLIAHQTNIMQWYTAKERAWMLIGSPEYLKMAKVASGANRQFSLEKVVNESLKIYRRQEQEIEQDYRANLMRVA